MKTLREGYVLVIDGKGRGQASCRKPAAGPWPVTVE